MLKFISFGSGSSGNCYYLFSETDGIIIDVGIGLRTLKKYFREYGLSLSSVTNILVTHDHADHVKSVGSLANEFKLPVYATEKVHDGIVHNYCVQKKIDRALVRNIVKGQVYSIGAFKVVPFAVPHDSSDNVGYRIEYNGCALCIITDAGCVTDEMKGYVSDAKCIVVEANYDEEMLEAGRYPLYLKKRILSSSGHLSNAECARFLAENVTDSLKLICLCHLSEENNHPELARKTVEAVLADVGVAVGRDVELEVLKRRLPTGIFDLA